MPRVFIRDQAEESYDFAARLILQRVRGFRAEASGKALFGIMVSASGAALHVCERLVSLHQRSLLSFENVTIYATHEYCGLAKTHPSSVHSVLYHTLLKHIDVKPQNVHVLDGGADAFAEECERFEACIARNGGVDLALVAPGVDGHVGFNMPGSSLTSTTRVKTLSSHTMKTHAAAHFPADEAVPSLGLTVGVQTIMGAAEVLTVVATDADADAVVSLTNSGITHTNALSSFQNHPKSTVIADEDSCEGMQQATYRYYKDLAHNALHNVDIPSPDALSCLHIATPCSPGSGVLKVVNVKLLRNGAFVSDDLWVRGGRIIDPAMRFWEAHDVEQYAAETIVDGHGALCCPGLIDIQINGAFGIDFTDPTLTAEGVDAVCRGVLAHGCTAFCPTVITSAPQLYRRNLELLPRRSGGRRNGASMIGCHLEGPFLSELKYGAHDKTLVTTPKNGFMDAVAMYGRMDAVAIVTLAPEVEGALPTIQGLAQRGVRVSLGHSNATLSETEAGVAHGANLVTHMFNAMRSFSHRDPGLIGILGSDVANKPYFGIIADGLHAHPASCRIAYEAHPEGCVLVTDAMEAMGMPPGSYKLAGKEVTVVSTTLEARYGGGSVNRATLAGTNTLAGAVPTLIDCVRNLMKFTGCSAADAINCASLHPARSLGIERKYAFVFIF